MNTELQKRLTDEAWLRKNEDDIKALFPDTWTHVENFGQEGMLKAGFRFKLLGLDWRSNDELVKLFTFFTKLGFVQRQNGYQIRGNPNRVMP